MTPDELKRMLDEIQLEVLLDLIPEGYEDVKDILRALVYNGCPFSAITKAFKQFYGQHMKNQEE